jgi:hypothetical protein
MFAKYLNAAIVLGYKAKVSADIAQVIIKC